MLSKIYAKIPKPNLPNESSASITFIMSVSDGWQLFLFLNIIKMIRYIDLNIQYCSPA